MRRLLSLLVVVIVAGTGGCDGGAASDEPTASTNRYTQGGGSMEPTVKPGQVITVSMVGRGYMAQHGNIVLFDPDPAQWGGVGTPFLKRVIAVGGETIACCDAAGKVTVNDTPLDEPYVVDNAPLDEPPNPRSCLPRRFGPVAVVKGTLFVMGDNRSASNDSRCLGSISQASVFAVMVS